MDIENKANSSLVFYDSGFLRAEKILYVGGATTIFILLIQADVSAPAL